MKKELFVILHNVRSAYNIGSIFRTADGMGAKKIYLTGYTQAPYDGKALYQTKPQKMLSKTALRAEKYVVWKKEKDLNKIIKQLKKEKVKIVALEQDKKSIDYRKFSPAFPLALILGNEPKGIDRPILNKCDATIEIPMRGKKKSLNVSVAFGIVGYELLNIK